MFLIDNIVSMPIRGVVWLAEKVHTAVQNEDRQEVEDITSQLTELYHLLEAGQISEAEFDEQEKELLDQLELHENGDN